MFRQSGRTGRPTARTSLLAQVADESARDAGSLSRMAKPKKRAAATTPRRRRADAERSVAAILDAALQALASDPEASMAEIARRAGVVRATIYVHFPTSPPRSARLSQIVENRQLRSSDCSEPRGRNSISSTRSSPSTRPGFRRKSSTAGTCPASSKSLPCSSAVSPAARVPAPPGATRALPSWPAGRRPRAHEGCRTRP